MHQCMLCQQWVERCENLDGIWLCDFCYDHELGECTDIFELYDEDDPEDLPLGIDCE